MPNKHISNNADAIRNWVADHFKNFGEFRTGDVVRAMAAAEDVRDVDGSYISSALNGWYKYNLIVNSYRLHRHVPEGKRPIWQCVPADWHATADAEDVPAPEGKTESATEKAAQTECATTKRKPRSNKFSGNVIAHKDDGSMIVQVAESLFKVQPFSW